MNQLLKLSPLKIWWLLAMIPLALGLVLLVSIISTTPSKDMLDPAYYDAVRTKLNPLEQGHK